jgi:signal transduction histidine kinase/CheY-like chemotaxis protein
VNRAAYPTEELWQLAVINRAISSSLDFAEVLNLIVDKAAELLDADTVVLLLADGDGVLQARAAAGGLRERVNGFAAPMREAALTDLASALGVTDERLLAAPLVSEAGVDGLLAAVDGRSDRAALLPMLADLAAIALRNARAHQVGLAETARRTAEQRCEALLDLQEAGKRSLPRNGEAPDYADLLATVQRLTGADVAALWETVHEEQRTFLRLRHSAASPTGEDDQWRGSPRFERVELSSTAAAARAGRSLEPVLARDLSTDAGGAPEGARCELALPLVARGELLGVVSLYSRAADGCESGSVRDLAEVLAGQLASAIDTANLVGELARASRLKDEFLATLSHELRNPLNAVVGYAEMLSMLPEVERSPEVNRAVKAIRRNALAQAQLVSDLLDLSRLQTGKLALQRELMPLEPALRNAAETVRVRAELKSVRLEVAPFTAPMLLNADPVRLEQIVWNLLDNAVKFSPEGSTVVMRAVREQAAARIEVEDRGQGIDPGFLPHVFEMFRQANPRIDRRHGGLGIGLALVRQLVELHGGRVRAKSEGVGKGATFSVWLPLAIAETSRRQSQPQEAAIKLDGLRILLVDDSEDALVPLSRLLELEGAAVRAVTSGRAAMELAATEPFDLLVGDISMPEMDGCELLRRLRQTPRGANLPAIALTGLAERENVEQVLAAGYAAHLAKPIDIHRFLRLARGVADARRAPALRGSGGEVGKSS